jgi:hypothetical protein
MCISMRYEILHHVPSLPLPHRGLRHGFDADIVPTLRLRLTPVPVRVPLPPPKGTIFELQAGLRTETFGAAM